MKSITDLMEIMEDRNGKMSTIIAARLPAGKQHWAIGEKQTSMQSWAVSKQCLSH